MGRGNRAHRVTHHGRDMPHDKKPGDPATSTDLATPGDLATPTAPGDADAFVEAEVARAIGLLSELLPPAKVAALEEMLRDTLESDPVAATLLKAARPRAVPLKSGEKDSPGATASTEAPPKAAETKGGR